MCGGHTQFGRIAVQYKLCTVSHLNLGRLKAAWVMFAVLARSFLKSFTLACPLV